MLTMTKMKRALSVLLCCIVLIAAAPLAVNTHLRETYVFTISHWLTKIRSPKAVFVGDSITAGAGWNFHGLSWFNVINLGAMGLTIHQIESLAKLAVTNYQPQFLFVMAGTNDVVCPHYHADEIKDDIKHLVDALAALPAQVTITLIPPTASPTYRERIGEMNGYLRSAAEAKGMRIIDLGPSLAPSGLLSPAYTTDGVHFSDSAYAVWRSEIEKAWTDLLRAYPEKIPAAESRP